MTEQAEEERREAVEHRDALLNIQAILNTLQGQQFFKYLFKTLSVNEIPKQGMEGPLLHDYMGYLRAGRSIFELVSEANPELAGLFLAQIEREKYDRLRRPEQTSTNSSS